MKFHETHFEEYVVSNQKEDLHPKMNKIFSLCCMKSAYKLFNFSIRCCNVSNIFLTVLLIVIILLKSFLSLTIRPSIVKNDICFSTNKKNGEKYYRYT